MKVEAMGFLTEAWSQRKQQHLFLTGPPGVGKTTMVMRLLQKLSLDLSSGVDVAGFYTEEVRDGSGQRCGFDVVRVGGGPADAPPRSALARVGQTPPRVGKYSIDVSAFEAFALPALEPPKKSLYPSPSGRGEAVSLPCEERAALGHEGLEEEAPRPRLCVCDEVGKMELLSLKFPATFLAALDSRAVLLGTLPQPARGQRDHELVEKVKKRADTLVLRITRNNRETLIEQAYATLRKCLGLRPPGQAARERGNKRMHEEEAEKRQHRAQTREEVDKDAEKEREQALKKARKEARDRERATQAKKLAKKKEVQAKKAREERKRRAAARKEARSLSRSKTLMEVEEEDDSEGDLEMESDVEALEAVEALDSEEEDVSLGRAVILLDEAEVR